jgi:hypothetical protein
MQVLIAAKKTALQMAENSMFAGTTGIGVNKIIATQNI